MSVQRVKMWQWLILSVVVGVVMGFFLLSAEDLGGSGTLSRTEFYRLVRSQTDDGKPVIHQIVISPIFQDVTGKSVQRVNFMMRLKDRQTGVWTDLPGDTTADIPYIKTNDNPDNRLSDFLAILKKDRPELDYRFSWWQVSGLKPLATPATTTGGGVRAFFRGSYPEDREISWWQYPRGAWMVIILASVLLIGVIWPMVIRLLVKLGLGMPEDQTTGVDLSKVSSRSTTDAPARTGMTDDDMDVLGDLNARLESNVAGMIVDDDALDHDAEQKAEAAVIKKLSNQPAERAADESTPAKPKDYTGEFYPVVKPGTSKK